MAESDLAPVDGSPTEAPTDTTPVFGRDDWGTDQPSADPEPEGGQPEEAPTTTEGEPAEEDLAAFRRQQDYTRKTMDLAEERRSFEAERTQWRQEMQQQREQLQQLLSRQQQPQTPTSGGMGDAISAYQQRLADPNLTPDQRMALQDELRGYQIVKGLEDQIADLKSQLGRVLPEFEQTSQTVQSLQQLQQQQTLAGVQRQHSEAVREFGEDTVNQAMPMVRRLAVVNGQWAPEVNPTTQQPYTFSEMVAIVTGKPAQSLQEATTASRNGRTQAKKRVAPTGAQAGSTDSRGGLSAAEVLAEIEATQAAGVI